MPLQTLKGFRDFLPPQAAARQWLKSRMISVFENWGYEPLETPTLEPYDLFKGEIGEDEKLFYKFKDLGNREVMLRYDQTVPTCRVVGQYLSQLTLPWRRYQIQSNFRAEKPQAGRFREFVQADIDIFGIASSLADAEAIAVSLDLYRTIGFSNVYAAVNNRDLMSDIPYAAISSIDKLKKIGADGVVSDMTSKGISQQQAKQYLNTVQNLQPDTTIKTIFDYLNKCGFPPSFYKFEPTLSRSFSYSQGPIWEIIVPEYTSGSVGGGERYDALVKRITQKDIPATGIAFGFDRTLEAALQLKLVPEFQTQIKIMVSIFSPETKDKSIELSTFLRQSGLPTELYPDDRTKLERQLKYAAAKGIPYVAILGPDEISKDLVTLKDLRAATQSQLPPTQIPQAIES